MQDIAITLALIVLCVFVFMTADGFKGESGMFPRIVAVITLALCAMQLVEGLYTYNKTEKEPTGKRPDPTGFYKAVISLVVYVLLIFILGYYVATAAYLLIGIYLFGYKKKLSLTLIVTGMIAGIYVLFTLMLRVQLPSGLII